MYAESDRRFQNLEMKVGVFLALSLIGLIVVLIYLGFENDVFTSRYKLVFTVDRGTGFSVGMPVKLSGFRIGRIDDIRLNDDARVDISMDIDREYSRWIRQDSVARLGTEGLVGDAILEVTAGSKNSPELIDGDRIHFEPSKSLEQHVSDIAEKIQPVLLEVRDIIGYIDDPAGDFKQSLQNINNLTGELRGTRGRVDNLLDATSTDIAALLRQADHTFNSLDQTLKRVDTILGSAEGDVPQILEKVNTTLGNLEKISTDLRSASDKVVPRLPGIVERADKAIDGAGTLVDSANNMWLFSSDAPAPEPQIFKSDSHD
ncbi:MAG: MCE family protein [Desulfuromonas sp.]|nr:MAG: MCE family protein [Desulfuromonas sp.]